jgi:hypothetical protein
MQISSPDNEYIAANTRPFFLPDRASDRRNITFNRALHNDVAAKRHRAMLNGTPHHDRTAHPKDVRFGSPIHNVGSLIVRCAVLGSGKDGRTNKSYKKNENPESDTIFRRSIVGRGLDFDHDLYPWMRATCLNH